MLSASIAINSTQVPPQGARQGGNIELPPSVFRANRALPPHQTARVIPNSPLREWLAEKPYGHIHLDMPVNELRDAQAQAAGVPTGAVNASNATQVDAPNLHRHSEMEDDETQQRVPGSPWFKGRLACCLRISGAFLMVSGGFSMAFSMSAPSALGMKEDYRLAAFVGGTLAIASGLVMLLGANVSARTVSGTETG
jgi:hypothetical protein